MLSYLLQASISLAVFYILYWFFLRKDTFFAVNRFYLLGSLILSTGIPLIDFSFLINQNQANYLFILDPITITASEINGSIQNNLSTYQTLLVIYFTGVGLFTARFIFQMIQIFIIRTRSKVLQEENATLILVKKNITPFSFLNMVFIQEKHYKDKDIAEVLKHELIHIRQRHSLDIIFAEIVCIVLWFNPFIWLYHRSLRSIHEYLADQGVIQQGVRKKMYQELLLSQTFGVNINNLTNNFNHSLIKRRFIMMTKSRSRSWERLKLLMILPMALAMVFVLMSNTNSLAQVEKETSKETLVKEYPNDGKVPPPPPKTSKDEKVYEKAEIMPEFPGGMKGLQKFFVENMKYPDIAHKANVSGTIFIGFIVNKSGQVKDAKLVKAKVDNPKNNKEAEEALIKESMRVIHMMPDWKPGYNDGKAVKVEMALPVRFNLDGGSEKEK